MNGFDQPVLRDVIAEGRLENEGFSTVPKDTARFFFAQ
jgi:hypothetical protein